MSDLTWKTAITEIAPNRVALRGYPVDRLIGPVPYASVVYLILRGELPDPAVAAVIDGILVSSVDHGASPPSTLAARTSASTGASLSAAVAAGILSINVHHGGAIEGCMGFLAEGLARREGRSFAELARTLIQEARKRRVRVPGFGHRLHSADPRAKRLLDLGDQHGVAADAVALASAMATGLTERLGRPMPLNVDGAIAALLADLGFEACAGNAFFMIARMPGLIAHVLEEVTRERPMRRIHPTDHLYDGPIPEELP